MSVRIGISALIVAALAAAACSADDTVQPSNETTPDAGESTSPGSSGGPSDRDDRDGSADLPEESCTFVRLESPVTTNLRGVWGASADDVWVGGEGFSAIAAATVLRFQNGTATKMSTANADSIWAISGTSASDVWFVGTLSDNSHSSVHHFDGKALALAHEAGNSLRAVWARTPDDVWAVGDKNVLHLTGGVWSTPSTPLNPGILDTFYGSSVAGASADAVLFGRLSGSALRWDGSKVTTGAQTPSLARLVHAPGGSYWAWDGDKLVKSADGTSWDTVKTFGKDEPKVVGLAARSDTDVWVLTSYKAIAGGYDGPFVDHFDGAKWHRTALEPGVLLNDIGLAGNSVWVVGKGGYVARCMLE